MTADACDVLIVGGGPAGSSCAWALRQSGLDVMVVDRRPFPRDKTSSQPAAIPVSQPRMIISIGGSRFAVDITTTATKNAAA